MTEGAVRGLHLEIYLGGLADELRAVGEQGRAGGVIHPGTDIDETATVAYDDVARHPSALTSAFNDVHDLGVGGIGVLNLEPSPGADAVGVGGSGVLDHGTLEALGGKADKGFLWGAGDAWDEQEGGRVGLGKQSLQRGTAGAVIAIHGGQVEQPDASIVGRAVRAEGTDRGKERLAGHGLAIERPDASLTDQKVEHLIGQMVEGWHRVAVASLEADGAGGQVRSDQDAEAVDLGLADVARGRLAGI